MQELIFNIPPVLGVLPLLPLIGLLFAGGVVATGAVVANNLSDEPETVNTFASGASQTNSNILTGSTSKLLMYGALAFGAWYFWKKRK